MVTVQVPLLDQHDAIQCDWLKFQFQQQKAYERPYSIFDFMNEWKGEIRYIKNDLIFSKINNNNKLFLPIIFLSFCESILALDNNWARQETHCRTHVDLVLGTGGAFWRVDFAIVRILERLGERQFTALDSSNHTTLWLTLTIVAIVVQLFKVGRRNDNRITNAPLHCFIFELSE